MTNFREIIGHAGTPVQQSLTVDPTDYANKRMFFPVMGIVMSVFPSDDDLNESAIRTSAQHGFLHQCSVLVTNDSNGQPMVLEKVIIPPNSLSGMDDYEEHLPRGCTKLLSGAPFNANLLGVDFTDLDGERCLVAFIDGKLSRPFILKWWPHPKNVYDPLTSGQGYQDANGVPQALQQAGRKFTRTNGVEVTITPEGDVMVDTNFSGSEIAPERPPAFGRFGRIINDEVGGDICVNVKPSKTLLIDFGGYKDGLLIGGYNDALPQTNPREFNTGATPTSANTQVSMDSGSFSVSSPDSANLYAGESMQLNTGKLYVFGENNIGINSSGDIRITSDANVTQLALKTHKTMGLEEVSVTAGFPSSTENHVAPYTAISTGEMTLRTGVIIDPTNPPATNATPGKMNIISTGDVVVKAGNSDDSSLPAGNTNITANGGITVQSGSDTSMHAGRDTLIQAEGSIEIESKSDSGNVGIAGNDIDIIGHNGVFVDCRDINLGSMNPLPSSTNAILLTDFKNFAELVAAKRAMDSGAPGTVDTATAAYAKLVSACLDALITALTNTATIYTKAE